MVKLTDKQQAFVNEYIIDFNAKQAAIRAGYSPSNAEVQASRMLSKGKVAESVHQALEERSKRTRIDADYVLKSLQEARELDIQDILGDSGNVLPIKEWPKAWRINISGLDLHEIMMGDTSTIVRKLKLPDKTRILELIGKHVTVGAFSDKFEHTGPNGGPIEVAEIRLTGVKPQN